MKRSRRRMEKLHGEQKEATTWYIDQYIFNNAGTATIKDIIAYREDINRFRVAGVIKKMSYANFLRTLYWRTIAEDVKKKVDYKCSLCGKKTDKLEVHHSTYEHHGWEHKYRKKDLICLCHDCHTRYHFLYYTEQEI